LADDFGFFSIRTATNSLEVFILWYGNQSSGPVALWIPELSIALARRTRVVVTHGASSAYADILTVYGT
jgi:hypothetical protein